uniref:ZZ-type domain-containing protein n=1 Tax=Mycena chlorophos TaxID=658473 RepID=A0ABQ0KWX0_MYCCL|nr:predicted protein [Mycena chlorophos]
MHPLLKSQLKAMFPTMLSYPELETSIGNGWVPLLRRLCVALAVYNTHIQFVQIKEKFGGLRAYLTSGRPEAWHTEHIAEGESFSVCERCGSGDARPASSGYWMVTTCAECLDARNAETDGRAGTYVWRDVRDEETEEEVVERQTSAEASTPPLSAGASPPPAAEGKGSRNKRNGAELVQVRELEACSQNSPNSLLITSLRKKTPAQYTIYRYLLPTLQFLRDPNALDFQSGPRRVLRQRSPSLANMAMPR